MVVLIKLSGRFLVNSRASPRWTLFRISLGDLSTSILFVLVFFFILKRGIHFPQESFNPTAKLNAASPPRDPPSQPQNILPLKLELAVPLGLG